MPHSLKTTYIKFCLIDKHPGIMRNIAKILVLIMALLTTPVIAQEIAEIETAELEKILNDKSDKIKVINFWATWCGPCVTEIPDFIDVAESYSEDEVSFLFVSLDFPSEVETKLIPFIKEYNIKENVGLITELEYSLWMDLVDPEWKGNLPATLIFNNAKNQRVFLPHVLEKEELVSHIEVMNRSE
jgi:thiol-disulfide isomerase/thioredoxin